MHNQTKPKPNQTKTGTDTATDCVSPSHAALDRADDPAHAGGRPNSDYLARLHSDRLGEWLVRALQALPVSYLIHVQGVSYREGCRNGDWLVTDVLGNHRYALNHPGILPWKYWVMVMVAMPWCRTCRYMMGFVVSLVYVALLSDLILVTAKFCCDTIGMSENLEGEI
jgi:hypothetical protein